MAFELTSSSFVNDGAIAKKHTCDGADLSVPLKWSDPPAGTTSLALICDDPDAPSRTWVHWVIYDLPANARELPEGVPQSRTLENGARQGLNDFQRIGYGGPCPPRGPQHRYMFTLYALSRMTGLQPESTKEQLLHAMAGHILGQAQLTGVYKR